MSAEPQQPAPKPVGLIQAVIYFLMASGHFLNTVTPILQIGFSQFMEIRNAVAQPPAPAPGPQPGRAGNPAIPRNPAAAPFPPRMGD